MPQNQDITTEHTFRRRVTGRAGGARALLNAALLALLACMAAPAMAAEGDPGTDKEGQVFKDWRLRCETAPNSDKEQCFVFQNLILKEGNKMLLNVVIGHADEQKRTVAIFTVPLGVSLPNGIALKIDEGEPKRIPIEHCLPQGCRAFLPLDEDLVTAMKRGSKGQVVFFDTGRKPVGVPLSLSGFTAAYNALGIPAAKSSE